MCVNVRLQILQFSTLIHMTKVCYQSPEDIN